MLREAVLCHCETTPNHLQKPELMGEVPEDSKMQVTVPIFKHKEKDSGNHKLFSLTLIPWKVELIVLETVAKHRKDKKVIGGSQNGFTKGKSCRQKNRGQ